MKENIETVIKILLGKASDLRICSSDAMKYTQAVANLANAIATLDNMSKKKV